MIYLVIGIIEAIIASIWLIKNLISGDLPNVSYDDDNTNNIMLNLINIIND